MIPGDKMKLSKQLESWLLDLSDIEKSELAAMILSEINPTRDNLVKFFDTLEASVHNELVNRASDREEKE
jgi:hypothetical protein